MNPLTDAEIAALKANAKISGEVSDREKRLIATIEHLQAELARPYWLCFGCEEPTEADLQRMRDLQQELQLFNDEVKAGRA